MRNVIDMLFDNQFFQLPFLEALSYIAAALMVGAIIVGLTRRALGTASPSPVATTYEEQPAHGEDTWEWRKAA